MFVRWHDSKLCSFIIQHRSHQGFSVKGDVVILFGLYLSMCEMFCAMQGFLVCLFITFRWKRIRCMVLLLDGFLFLIHVSILSFAQILLFTTLICSFLGFRTMVPLFSWYLHVCMCAYERMFLIPFCCLSAVLFAMFFFGFVFSLLEKGSRVS